MTRLAKVLLLFVGSAAPATAGWDNVFQLTCCDGPPARTSYSVPLEPAANCEPQQKVQYVQRCYSVPETTYTRESYYVPQRENVTSQYLEPVTSMKYSSYYDPCSGCCKKLAMPTTSYVVKERCNSVVRWVEQSRVVPVTSYKTVTMYTPVVTTYYPPVSSPSSFKLPLTAPRIDESRTAPAATIPDGIIPKTDLPVTPGTPGSTPRVMPKTSNSSSAYTASRTKASLRGEVVKNDQATPRPGTKVIFLNSLDTSKREETVTGRFGEFDVTLPAGEWYVYLGQGDGRAVFHKKLTVAATEVRDVTLVSR